MKKKVPRRYRRLLLAESPWAIVAASCCPIDFGDLESVSDQSPRYRHRHHQTEQPSYEALLSDPSRERYPGRNSHSIPLAALGIDSPEYYCCYCCHCYGTDPAVVDFDEQGHKVVAVVEPVVEVVDAPTAAAVSVDAFVDAVGNIAVVGYNELYQQDLNCCYHTC